MDTSFRKERTGNPVRIRNEPVTVIRSFAQHAIDGDIEKACKALILSQETCSCFRDCLRNPQSVAAVISALKTEQERIVPASVAVISKQPKGCFFIFNNEGKIKT